MALGLPVGNGEFDPITLEILWSRLIALVEDSVNTLVRTAFSPSVREANDMTCALMDRDGNALAQSLISTPLHTGVKSITMRALLGKFPQDSWAPGDAAISNDPWIGTGHRNDVTIVRPIFQRRRLVGFALNDAHWSDIGGAGMRVENRDVFEEGLGIPNTLILRGGTPNADLYDIIRLNTRTPDQTLGDLHGQLVASERLAASVEEMLDDCELDGLEALARAIYATSERSMRDAISALPPGTYESEISTDGLDEPIHLKAAVTVGDNGVTVDYAGSSQQTACALNAVWNYTYAWTVFALKAALEPGTPNNDGCLRPFVVEAPEGSVLNPRWGAPVSVRHQTGHYLPTLVLSALGKAAPPLVPAEAGSPPHRSVIVGRAENGTGYGFTLNASGGLGASDHHDGAHCMAFPTNTVATSLEVLEGAYPVVIWERELLTDSGGAGRFRGGCGQRIAFEYVGELPAHLSPLIERVNEGPAGLAGGNPGGTAAMTLNGKALRPKAQVKIHKHDRLEIFTCGGGGYGHAHDRHPADVQRDVADGLVSEQAASDIYRQTTRP